SRDPSDDRQLFPAGNGDTGGLSDRDAICRSARGTASRSHSPELRLFAPCCRTRPCRRRQLLWSLRLTSHLRSTVGGRASYQATDDRRHILLPEVLWNGNGENLSARSEAPHIDLRHATARNALDQRGDTA